MNPVAGGSSDARLVPHALIIANEVAQPATVGDDGGFNTCVFSGGRYVASRSAFKTILCMMECT